MSNYQILARTRVQSPPHKSTNPAPSPPVQPPVRRFVQIILIAAGILLVPALVAPFAGLRPPQWKRELPLAHAIAVTNVHDGTLTLADGRTLRPAGITRRANTTAAQFDQALRIMTAQGITITRELGDGTALLHCEPRFFNTCGTSKQGRFFRPGWAGSYLPCPLSELLIIAAYADPMPESPPESPNDTESTSPAAPLTPTLTPHERWRLQAATHIRGPRTTPDRIFEKETALQFSPEAHLYDREYNTLSEVVWQPPP